MSEHFTPEDSPQISLPTNEGDIILHYFNSRLRTFADTQYDHVELYEDDRTKGLRVGRAVMDAMFEHQFPMQFDPIVDEATFEWFVQSEARILERELDEM